MNTPLEVLTTGRELLADPKNWTQRTLARNKAGESVEHPWDPKATCFCSIGAVHKVLGRYQLDLKFEVKRLLDCVAGGWMVSFNDRHTHAEVLEAWDKAIELAKSDARHQ
jgi:hypothetical protein